MIMKDNFCEFTFYIILAHHNSCHSIYHMAPGFPDATMTSSRLQQPDG